ncbi:MAG: SDR family NAD(P)-dependent oxidoreductase [Gemmataceae bacterium]
MKCDLNGKVSLVTGAARGIGQAIADRLAANGSRVVYTDLDPVATEAAAARSGGAGCMDVTRTDEIEAVIGGVVAEFGRLDILVNNAGVNTLAHRVTIDEFPRAEWDRLLSVDLTGVVRGEPRSPPA